MDKEQKYWIDKCIDDTSEFKNIPDNLKYNKDFILMFLYCLDNYMWNILFKLFDDNSKQVINFLKKQKALKVIPEKYKEINFIKQCVEKYNFLYLELPNNFKTEDVRNIVSNNDIIKYYIDNWEK